jgi:hypothetical protein
MSARAAAGLFLGMGVGCGAPSKPNERGDSADSGPAAEGPRACNGHPDLCDRPLDAVRFPGTHNSMSAADEGWLGPNQGHGIERQLEDGVRAMMFDTYEVDGELLLCHGYCSLGSRPLMDALQGVDAFLAAHPDELLLLILQDGTAVEATTAAFEAAGLGARTYDATPQQRGEPWPTLGELTAGGHQLIVSAESQGPPPAWYHHAWALFSDTPYSFRSIDEMGCGANRGDAQSPLFLVNHWLGPLPSEDAAAAVNLAEVLRARVEACEAERGKVANFVAVDHYQIGDLLGVVAALNGLD